MGRGRHTSYYVQGMARVRVEAEEVEKAGVVIVLIINGNRMHWPSPRTVETLDSSPLLTRKSIETQ